MANETPPIRTCVLRVGIKCCKGCQIKAKRKLLNVPGVSSVEYNVEQGLLTVTGDNPDPATLLRKLTKWGKHAELVSNSVLRTPEHNQTETMAMRKKERPRATNCCLLNCFRKQSSKAKVKPYPGPGALNRPMPSINAVLPPPMVYPPPQAIPGFATPIPYPPPFYGSSHQASPYNAGMFRPAPPHIQLRQTQFPQMVNSRLHYPHY